MNKLLYKTYNFLHIIFKKLSDKSKLWSDSFNGKSAICKAEYMGLETKWFVQSYATAKEALRLGKPIKATKIYLLGTIRDRRTMVCVLTPNGIPTLIRASRIHNSASEAINKAIQDLQFNPTCNEPSTIKPVTFSVEKEKIVFPIEEKKIGSSYISLPTEGPKEDEVLTEKEQEQVKAKEEKIRKNQEQKNRHKKNKQKGKVRK